MFIGLRLALDRGAGRTEALLDSLRSQFPNLACEVTNGVESPSASEVDVSLSEWLETEQDFDALDEKMSVLDVEDRWVTLRCALEATCRPREENLLGRSPPAVEGKLHQWVEQFVTRYQRYLPVAPHLLATLGPALCAHRQMHDRSKPLVRADYDHAIDVWRWTLRLQPQASTALQLSALFHDVERLETEADFRVEQHAQDYQSFKDRHAHHGARLTAAVLQGCGYSDVVCAEVAELIEAHERPKHSEKGRAATLLADADALSFFSLNSSGFLNYYGPAHTRFKIAFSLGRMTPASRRLLSRVHLRADVKSLLSDVLARTQGHTGTENGSAWQSSSSSV